MRALIGAGLIGLALLHPTGSVVAGQDHDDPNQFMWAGKKVYIPVVPDYVPKVKDQVFARVGAVAYPTRDEFVERCNDYVKPNAQHKMWHDKLEPYKLEPLDRLRVIEVYPPDPRLGVNAKNYLMVLIEVESGRLRGVYRIMNRADIALPTLEGRAMIRD